MKNKTLTTVLISFFLAALAFSGCRTMEGAGNDIERAGEKISDEARDARN